MTRTEPVSPFSRDFQREQKRRAILSEASRLFNIHGARSTTLDDISASLQLNKASLYYYVKSKDDLVFQCYIASCQALQAMTERARTRGKTGADRLAAFVREYFRAWQAIMQNRAEHMAILSELRGLQPAYRQQIVSQYRDVQAEIRRFMREGNEDGSLRVERVGDAALALFGSLQLTVLWLPRLGPDDFDSAADSFLDIVFHGVGAGHPESMSQRLQEAANSRSLVRDRPVDRRLDGFCRSGSELFNGKGFKGASLDEIVKRLQVTKGSFYHHFEDKDELLYRCFRRSLSLIERVQQGAADMNLDGVDTLLTCAGRLFRIQNSEWGPLVRFNLIPSLAARYREEVLRDIRRVSEGFGQVIRRGVEDGSIRRIDPFIAEQMLTSAIDISAELQWMRPVKSMGADCRSYFGYYFCGMGDGP
jgi:AcrR family transcriptional regulator